MFKHLSLLAALTLFPALAMATLSNVSGPGVEQGEGEVEVRLGADIGDEREDATVRSRLHVEYGFTEYLSLRAVGKQYDRDGGDTEYDATDIEARLQFFDREIDGFDGGIKLVYSARPNEDRADTASLQWLAEHRDGTFRYRYNVVASHDVGEYAESGLGFGLRGQIMPDTKAPHRLGMEFFSDFGKLNDQHGYDAQKHTLGPVLKGKFTDSIEYETGVQLGVSDSAPAIGVKFFLSYAF